MSKACIVIHVQANGETTVRAEGFSGDTCLKATQEFESALGRSGERHYKADYFQSRQSTDPLAVETSGSDTTSREQQ